MTEFKFKETSSLLMKKKPLTLSLFDSTRDAPGNFPPSAPPREHAFTDNIEFYSECNPASFASGEEEKAPAPPSFFPSDNVSEASS